MNQNIFEGKLTVSLPEAATAAFGWLPSTTASYLCRGKFPIPFVQINGVKRVRVADLLNFVDGFQPVSRSPKKKPGRPTKAAQLARAGGCSMNAALATLQEMRLQDDVRQSAAELVLKGKPLAVALRHARAQVARDLRPAAFISLDERLDEGDFSFYERVAGVDPSDFLDYTRKSKTHQFNTQTESVLLPLGNGAADLGRALNRTGRRGQQIVKEQIQRAAGEFGFKVGENGQGELFGFDGEVV